MDALTDCQGKIGEDKARHAAMLDDVARGPDHDSRNAIGFEVPGYQTHGLVADRSERREECGLGAVLL